MSLFWVGVVTLKHTDWFCGSPGFAGMLLGPAPATEQDLLLSDGCRPRSGAADLVPMCSPQKYSKALNFGLGEIIVEQNNFSPFVVFEEIFLVHYFQLR